MNEDGLTVLLYSNVAATDMVIDEWLLDMGDVYWLNADGVLHRSDGPAIECANGDKMWYINGKLHRKGAPAVMLADGTRVWYTEGKIDSSRSFQYRKIHG